MRKMLQLVFLVVYCALVIFCVHYALISLGEIDRLVELNSSEYRRYEVCGLNNK